MTSVKICGLDLAGKDKNETGFCLIEKNKHKKITTKILHTNEEILNEIEKAKPDLIAIDAPFDFPKDSYYRKSDILLREHGVQPLSPLFRGMKPLVERAKILVKILRDSEGGGGSYEVIEVFSKASERIMGLERDKKANKDEYDAVLCALTGEKYLEGNYENLDGIIIPK